MTFPKTHANGEVWDGAAVSDLESRAAAALGCWGIAARRARSHSGRPQGEKVGVIKDAIRTVLYPPTGTAASSACMWRAFPPMYVMRGESSKSSP